MLVATGALVLGAAVQGDRWTPGDVDEAVVRSIELPEPVREGPVPDDLVPPLTGAYWDNPDGYEKSSLARRAANLSGRLLLVHGTYDDNVHPQNAWRFADELIEAGIPFDMMIYPMRKHGIRDDAAQKHLYGTMMEFWDRNLK